MSRHEETTPSTTPTGEEQQGEEQQGEEQQADQATCPEEPSPQRRRVYGPATVIFFSAGPTGEAGKAQE